MPIKGKGKTKWIVIYIYKLGIKLYYSNFPYASNPFFIRGGNYNNGSNAGPFYFNNNNGWGNNNYSFRVVLF